MRKIKPLESNIALLRVICYIYQHFRNEKGINRLSLADNFFCYYFAV